MLLMDVIVQELSKMYGVEIAQIERELLKVVLENENIIMPKEVKNQKDDRQRFMWFLTGVLLGKYNVIFDTELVQMLKTA